MVRQDCEHLPLALCLAASRYAMFRAWASKRRGKNTMQGSQSQGFFTPGEMPQKTM